MAESARSGGVRIESRGHVGVCTIDDPSTRNALGPELMRAIVAGLERLDEDPEVRVIALVGRNEVFATGADPRVLAAAEPDAEAETDFWARFDAIGAPIVTQLPVELGSALQIARLLVRLGRFAEHARLLEE